MKYSTYEEYTPMEKSHEEMLSEIGNDEDAESRILI